MPWAVKSRPLVRFWFSLLSSLLGVLVFWAVGREGLLTGRAREGLRLRCAFLS